MLLALLALPMSKALPMFLRVSPASFFPRVFLPFFSFSSLIFFLLSVGASSKTNTRVFVAFQPPSTWMWCDTSIFTCSVWKFDEFGLQHMSSWKTYVFENTCGLSDILHVCEDRGQSHCCLQIVQLLQVLRKPLFLQDDTCIIFCIEAEPAGKATVLCDFITFLNSEHIQN